MKNKQNKYIGNIFCNAGVLSETILENIFFEMETETKPFIQIIINKNIDFDKLSIVLKEKFSILNFEHLEGKIDKELLKIISYEVANKYNILPIQKTENTIIIAMENPFDSKAIDDLGLLTNLKVIPALINSNLLKINISKNYSDSKISLIASQFLIDENLKKEIYNLDETIKENIQNAPAVKLIDSLIESAVLLNASDIHIEPFKHIIRTRYRIDGILKEFQSVDIKLLPNIISRLKIMGTLDISEKRLPQDGHFNMKINNTNIDFRLSTISTIYGEKAVIRMIYTNEDVFDKKKLGFFKEDLEKIDLVLKNKYGAILVTGPTGSGKSTTISSFLNDLNSVNINIVTIEDPVENAIHGINQININPKASLDFSNILRSILRQDPDIIMIGEIRDQETAKITIQAAITGHLVLTTLHTSNAISSIIRLMDMGVERFLLTTAIQCIISQMLVRRLCDNCKIQIKIKDSDAKFFDIPKDTLIYKPCGCSICNNTGYKGRFAVYELLLMDETLELLIEKKATQEEIKKTLIKNGFKTIEDCIKKNVILGNTSIEYMYNYLF